MRDSIGQIRHGRVSTHTAGRMTTNHLLIQDQGIFVSRYKELPDGGLLANLTDFISLVPLRPGAWQSEQAISRSEQALWLGHY